MAVTRSRPRGPGQPGPPMDRGGRLIPLPPEVGRRPLSVLSARQEMLVHRPAHHRPGWGAGAWLPPPVVRPGAHEVPPYVMKGGA